MKLTATIRAFAVILLGLVLAACHGGAGSDGESLQEFVPEATGYNVLVVSFDALRADALGIYGYPRETSPNIDTLAARSVVFENAYAAAPVTPTSFAAAFTGQYPYRTFIGWQLIDTVTLARVMQGAGYSTFGIFNNVQLARGRNFDQGFEHYVADHQTDENLLHEAKRLISEHASTKFFGWVHFISPHTPYDYRDLSAHLAPAKAAGRFATTSGAKFEIQQPEELQRVRELYDGEVYYADDLFGRLMAFLEEEGLASKTLIVLTSDHGEEFLEHGQTRHNSTHEEVVHIPLILHHPGMEKGVRTRIPYLNTDLLPTLAALAGIEQPVPVDGIDLFHSADPARPRLVTGMTNKQRYEIMIEQDGKKLMQVCTPEFQEALYDLDSDPGEQNDLILQRPDIANRLFDQLQGITIGEPCQVIVDASRGETPYQSLDDEQIEQLRALGYIQ